VTHHFSGKKIIPRRLFAGRDERLSALSKKSGTLSDIDCGDYL
jgi:hypothetical protein